MDGDVDGAEALLEHHPDLATHSGYKAHPLLRDFVDRNNGHCYKHAHMFIADLLIPENVRCFRNAVLNDLLDEVRTVAGPAARSSSDSDVAESSFFIPVPFACLNSPTI